MANTRPTRATPVDPNVPVSRQQIQDLSDSYHADPESPVQRGIPQQPDSVDITSTPGHGAPVGP